MQLYNFFILYVQCAFYMCVILYMHNNPIQGMNTISLCV